MSCLRSRILRQPTAAYPNQPVELTCRPAVKSRWSSRSTSQFHALRLSRGGVFTAHAHCGEGVSAKIRAASKWMHAEPFLPEFRISRSMQSPSFASQTAMPMSRFKSHIPRQPTAAYPNQPAERARRSIAMHSGRRQTSFSSANQPH